MRNLRKSAKPVGVPIRSVQQLDAKPPYHSLAALGSNARTLIGHHFDRTFRTLSGPGIVAHRDFFCLVSGEAHPLGNLAVLASPVTVATAKMAVEALRALPVPSAVVFPGLEVPPDVAASLAESGYIAAGQIPAMGVDSATLKDTSLPTGYELVRVGSDTNDSAEWVHQFSIGYGLPLGLAQYFAPAAFAANALADGALEFFAVRRNGAIVATSLCFLAEGVAGTYCVATVPEERRKGLGEHVMAEPLRRAARRGYRVGVLQSSEAGYNVYKRLGFADFGGLPIFVRIPQRVD